jgi:hypothetical protein
MNLANANRPKTNKHSITNITMPRYSMLPSVYASDSKGARQSADADEWRLRSLAWRSAGGNRFALE